MEKEYQLVNVIKRQSSNNSRISHNYFHALVRIGGVDYDYKYYFRLDFPNYKFSLLRILDKSKRRKTKASPFAHMNKQIKEDVLAYMHKQYMI